MQRWDGLDAIPADLTGCVATIGFFDGVHSGHQRIVSRAVERAGALGLPAVVVTFDPHPSAVVRPGSEPLLLTTTRHKAELMAALGVDALDVITFTKEFSQLEPAEFAKTVLVDRLRVRAVVVGANFRFGRRAAGDVSMLAELGDDDGFAVEAVELVADGDQPWSSTYVRRCVAEGDVAGAATALGRPHRVEGVVVRGDGRGKQLGFPTANLAPPDGYAVPADGVYAGWLVREPDDAGAQRWPAAISVGTNPTFDGEQRRVEAHVIDRDVDLYDRYVAVEFGHWLRGMERFDSIDALVTQIGRDVRQARQLVGGS